MRESANFSSKFIRNTIYPLHQILENLNAIAIDLDLEISIPYMVKNKADFAAKYRFQIARSRKFYNLKRAYGFELHIVPEKEPHWRCRAMKETISS